jgi:DNA ligase-1
MNTNQSAQIISILELFLEIESTRGTNAKKAILEREADNDAFKQVLSWFLNNLNPTGIAARKLSKTCDSLTDFVSLQAMTEYLDDNNTGRDEDVGAIQNFMSHFTSDFATAIAYLATKKWNKGLGIDATTANAVYGEGFVPQFKVMLAEKYWDDVEYWNDKTFGIQSKLDGFRTVIIKRKGKVTVWARSGKDLTGKFPEIEQAMRDLPFDNIVFDGERMPVGFDSMTSKETYKIASNARKLNNTGYCIAVYDYMPVKDWDKQHCNQTYNERYSQYREILKDNEFLYPLELLYIGTDSKQIKKLLDEARANDKEGVILKDMDAMYEWERGQAIVKVKVFEDIDLPIIGFKPGKGKLKDSLGALIVDFEGNEVRVGSGFSEELRKEIWANQKEWLGKIVEIVYFEKTTNNQGGESLRFPVYKTRKDLE